MGMGGKWPTKNQETYFSGNDTADTFQTPTKHPQDTNFMRTRYLLIITQTRWAFHGKISFRSGGTILRPYLVPQSAKVKQQNVHVLSRTTFCRNIFMF